MLNNIKLGKFFTFGEFTKSTTALRLGLDNFPESKTQLFNMMMLTQWLLDPLREAHGKPIIITSGYRSPELNKAIGGSERSQHSLGQAVDIESSDGNNTQLFNLIRTQLVFDQLIWEFGNDNQPSWVHVSYIYDKPRKEILRAYKIDGVTKYEQL